MRDNLTLMESTEYYLTKALENSDAVEILRMFPYLNKHVGGSSYKIPQKRQPGHFTLKFIPSFIEILEEILPETGHIVDDAGAAAAVDYTERPERVTFLDEVLTLALTSHNKKDYIEKLTDKVQERDVCSRCQTATKDSMKSKCGHFLCPMCFGTVYKQVEVCPVCTRNSKGKTGNMPPGDMSVRIIRRSLPGYDCRRTIQIHYSIAGGVRTDIHSLPRKPFRGTDTTAYLPDNTEGQKVLDLLNIAWERRLTFKIDLDESGYFLSLRIPHKTNMCGGREKDGYPDPGYLRTVQRKLAEYGVTEQDL